MKGKGYAQLLESTDEYITPEQAAEAAGWAPQQLRAQAHNDPAKLGFPVVVIGSRTYIPRVPFLKHMGVIRDTDTTAALAALLSRIYGALFQIGNCLERMAAPGHPLTTGEIDVLRSYIDMD